VIPPEKSAGFVAQMEEVLDLYQQPYDPVYPVVNMDEKPVQLIAETRTSIPAKPGKPQRYAYEYARKGTASIFLFTEPLTGWRKVDAQPQRTAAHGAHQVKILLDEQYPEAEQVILVCDNLNTHKTASLYEAFEPAQARRLARRLDIRYTPKHGSWLNIAEVELSVLTSQCLDRRIADLETMQKEIQAWEQERNTKQSGVDWRFTTEDARIRLKRLYPQFQS
jgi:DDE superfamily endonuclease